MLHTTGGMFARRGRSWRNYEESKQKFGVKEGLQNEGANSPHLHQNTSSSPPRVWNLSLFDFVIEIRLKIYSELLVHSEPIRFEVGNVLPSPSLLWNHKKRENLCPALLRVNKKVHGEASPLLYSKNRFRFPDIYISKPYRTYSPCIAPFLRQIGSQASLLRHICIDFPTFRDSRRDKAELHEAHIKNLELIRDTCIGLTTLELMFPPPSYGDAPITAEELGLLDTRFKSILSLKEVIVNFRVYDVEHRSDDWIKMRDRGWTVEVTKVWPSSDDRAYFENEEECEAYDQKQSRLEWEREQEEQEEQWTEEYYRRRNDPYWKNDSDYD